MSNLIIYNLSNEEEEQIQKLVDSFKLDSTHAEFGELGYSTMSDLPYIISAINTLLLDQRSDCYPIDIDNLTHSQKMEFLYMAANNYSWQEDDIFLSGDAEYDTEMTNHVEDIIAPN